jgi:hypothetical protein
MLKLRQEAILRAAPERVWALLADWDRQASWMPDVAWIRVLGTERELGARLAVRTKVFGVPAVTDRLLVSGWEPPRRLRIEHLGLVSGWGEWRLDLHPAGTAFAWRESLTMAPPVLGELGLWFYSPVQRWMLRRSIRNLKGIVER